MKKVQRHEMILLKELHTQKTVSLEHAMQLLQVSESTVRRLFAAMEQKGVCVRSGGCIRLLNNDFTNFYVYEHMEDANVTEKTTIAQKALSYIKPGDILFLDAGTTLAKLSTEIVKEVEEKRLHDITIFTNSLVNFNLLKDHTTVQLTGGLYRENRKDFCGNITEMILRQLRFDKCFVGTDGYSKSKGFIATDLTSASLLKSVIESSNQQYVLADVNKFTETAGMCFAEASGVTAVITNNPDLLSPLASDGFAIV